MEELACEPRRPPLAGRLALLLAGCGLSTLCYAVTVRAGIGLGPLFVLQDGLARRAGVALGTAVMALGAGMVLLAACLGARPGPGTVAIPFLSGSLLDYLLPRLPQLHGWGPELAAVTAATWLMGLGGAAVIRASLGVAAYDAVMLGLNRSLGRSLAPIRWAMEATVLLAGWVLGGAVGVGTVITGLLIAPAIQFWVDLLGRVWHSDTRHPSRRRT
jgi:uncharacterized membrane protein YczE